MKVVVGLGNPGQQYQGTRHNIGFEVLYEFGRRFQAGGVKLAHSSETAECHFDGEKILLVAPQTYMNLSGRAVGELVKFYKLEPADILVVCDDLNLPCGQLRLRSAGSSGGQKGIKDIIAHLGTEDFPRLRFGIGRPPGRMDVSTFVLKPFLAEERPVVQSAIDQAVQGIEWWLREGITQAMNRLNTKSASSADS